MKILLIDIETAPNLAWVWGKYEQNVIQFKKEWSILSFASKWLGDKHTQCITTEFQSERKLVKAIWKLLDEADIVIGHNGNQFDLKRIRAKFLEYDLRPPSPYKQIDTLSSARSQFGFMSNSLGDLGVSLKIGSKLDNGGFKTWLGCMSNDRASWKKMVDYNIKDVELLEKVYLRLRPYITNHPAVSQTGCPSCASTKTRKSGVLVTRTAKKQTHRCLDCGKRWTEGRV